MGVSVGKNTKTKFFVTVFVLLFGFMGAKYVFADPTYTVSGAVTIDGTPVPDALVNIIGTQQRATTDTNGFYSIPSIPSGSFQVQVDQRSVVPNMINARTTNSYVTVSGDTTRDLAFATNKIAVTVFYTDGSLDTGATVALRNTSASNVFFNGTDGQGFSTGANNITGGVTTDSNGVASIPVFTNQTYNLCARAYDSNEYCAALPVTVNSDTTATITDVPKPPPPPSPGTVSGTVTIDGALVPDAKITLEGSGKPSVYVDNNGYYSISDVPGGSYRIQVDNLTSIIPNFVNAESQNNFVNINGDITQNLSFVTNKITTGVYYSDGTPYSNTTVRYRRVSGANFFPNGTDGQNYYASVISGGVTSDSSGSAVLPVFATQTYVVCVIGYDSNEYCAATPITVNSDTTATITDVPKPPPPPMPGTVSGTVILDGNPVPNALVNIIGTQQRATTDVNGFYSVPLVPGGSYQVQVDQRSIIPYFVNARTTSNYVAVNGNTTRDVTFATSKIATTVYYADGSLDTNTTVRLRNTSASNVFFDGTDGQGFLTGANNITSSDTPITDANGLANVPVFTNQTYILCVSGYDSNDYCSAPIAVSSNTTATITGVPKPPQFTPPTPLNLTAATPIKNPNLVWDASSGATSYNIYRNGTKVDSTSSTTYIDSSSPEGANTYYVTAENTGGESSDSNSVNILVDRTQPIINYSLSPTPNSNSWNNGNVVVNFTCSDSGSGISVCPGSTTLTGEGGGQIISGTATDNAGNSASVSAMVNIDKTAPTVSNVSWTANPLQQGQTTILSASANDNLSGVASVSYSIDGGAPQTMTYDSASNTWKASFGSSLAVNTYNITVTATDQAVNNSSAASDVLAIYTTSNGYVTGHAKTLPTATDTMPIARDTSNNPTKLIIGFTNATAPASGSFDINYRINNNQNEFSLSSTNISWVVVQDTTHARILGHGDINTYVNGVKTVTQNVAVRFDITLGTSGAADQVSIKIFSPSVDPNSGTPAYVINDAVISSGSNLMIHP